MPKPNPVLELISVKVCLNLTLFLNIFLAITKTASGQSGLPLVLLNTHNAHMLRMKRRERVALENKQCSLQEGGWVRLWPNSFLAPQERTRPLRSAARGGVLEVTGMIGAERRRYTRAIQ